MLRRFAPLVAAFVLAGCAGAASNPSETPVTPPTPPPAAESPASARDFDVAFYRAVAAEPGNQFVSPYSASAAFGLVYAGASGAVAREMSTIFGYHASPAQAAANANAVANGLRNAGGSELNIANAAWVDRSFPLQSAYQQTIRERFGGAIETLDFVRQPEAARQRINRAVSEATRERIPELLERDFIQPETRLVLTNAVYFKGRWSDQFDPNDTRDSVFYGANGEQDARMMNQTTRARYFDNDAFQAAEFDYDSGAFALAVFLPRAESSIGAFEQTLSGANLQSWMDQLAGSEARRLRVGLPQVEMERDYDLIPPLQAMGMRAIFQPSGDLAGISNAGPLSVNAAVQKTFLAIGEEGTEAAAATGVGVALTAAPVQDVQPILFRAERPFFIVLHHKASGAILFMGRVAVMGG